MRSFRFFMSMLTIRYISFTTSLHQAYVLNMTCTHMIVQRSPVQVHDYSYAQDYTQQMFGSFASKTALFRGVRRSVFSGFFFSVHVSTTFRRPRRKVHVCTTFRRPRRKVHVSTTFRRPRRKVHVSTTFRRPRRKVHVSTNETSLSLP